MSKAKKVTIFENGNVAVWDEGGQQVAPLQGSFYDYKYMNKLAKAIAEQKLDVDNYGFDTGDFEDRIKHFKKLTPKTKGER